MDWRRAGHPPILDPDEILAGGLAAAESRLLRELTLQAATISRVAVATMFPDRALSDLDSGAATMLREYAAVAFGLDIPIERLSGAATLQELARLVALEVAQANTPEDDDFRIARNLNPALAHRLRTARLDRIYVRGSGSILVDSEDREVIDFVAQFGALPFGHNPGAIWDAVNAVRHAQTPIMAALSLPLPAARLAERLTSLAPPGLDRAFFCSSGSEAIEAAIKLCRAATGRAGVLSTIGGFHGLTLAALSATGRAAYQEPFGDPIPGFDKVLYGDLTGLRDALDRHAERYAAFIVEPLQGEGGIVEPPAGYLAEAAKLCRSSGVAFVLDEVQTGLGRCGTLFASSGTDVIPDVMTLAKALGGGLVPVGAVLYRTELATDAFMLRHGSTFANNVIGCAAAMATLDRLTADGNRVMKQVAERGAQLKAKLQAIRNRHPQIVPDVRGRGYLLGIEFSAQPKDYEGSISSLFCRSESFGFLLTSYLLEHHGVRVAPAINQTAVLRVEPALDIPPTLFAPLIEGIEELAEALDRGDSPAVLGHILGLDPDHKPIFVDRRTRMKPTRAAAETDGRFAFLVHMMDLDDLQRFDPSLEVLSSDTFADARAMLPDLLKPAALTTFEVGTPDGRRAVGDLIIVPYTAHELMDMPLPQSRQIIGDAVTLGAERGAQVVGLGGFTSVVTGGGRSVAKRTSVLLTTGNALTALTTVQAIDAALATSPESSADIGAMIFGAFGSIGSAVTKLLARRVGRLCLIVKNEHRLQLEKRSDFLRSSLRADLASDSSQVAAGSVAAALLERKDTSDILAVAGDPGPYWRTCKVVVTATSALGELVTAGDLAPGAIVCDVSRPVNVSRKLPGLRPDVTLIEGGVIKPHPPFDSGFDLGVGRDRTYACMAEAMLLALERDTTHNTVGQEIDIAKLSWLESAAQRAGFQLSGWTGFADRVAASMQPAETTPLEP